jgi:hypothetical protein
MSKEFPHLSDNAFPYLDTVGPYDIKMDMDYRRYDYEATAKLCNVSWPHDYSHVVNWGSEDTRDAWFRLIDGDVIELSQGFARSQLDEISLPIPYDVALLYNYVYLRIPQLTDDEPIDYEGKRGLRTVCAFVSDVIYRAPSTTTFVLEVDMWTTYLPHLSVNAMMLTRGHAPMYATSVDDYLRDPINHSADLLTPDVDFGGTMVTRGGAVLPLSTALYVMVFASTIPRSNLDSIPRATNANQTGPTYYDTGARNGEQVGVSGFVWAANGKSYYGMNSPSAATHFDMDTASGLYYYAMYTADMYHGALDTLFNTLPVFALSVKAAYVIPSDLVSLGTEHTVGSAKLYEVTSRPSFQSVGSIKLERSMFDIPSSYAEITKLYTAPYSVLELSDDAGQTMELRVEDTHGTIDVKQLVSATWPMLRWDVAFTNVESTAQDLAYTWVRLNDAQQQKSVPGADFAARLLDFGIPTYSLYLNALTEAALTSQIDEEQAKRNAVLAYQNTMRSANTGEQNAYASNATAKSNADASADTAKTNTDASADTAKANTTTSTNASRSNATTQNEYRSLNEQNARTYTTDGASTDLTLQEDLFAASMNQNQFASLSQVSNIASQSIGATAANMYTGNYEGAALSAINGLSGALTAGASYLMAASTEAAIVSATSDALYDKAAAAAALGYVNANNANSENTDLTTRNANAADTIASNSQATAKANASRSQSTSKANATRTKGTGDSNAGYTQSTAMENAKATLENAQLAFASSIRHQEVEPSVPHGAYSGDAIHEQMQGRNVHLRVKTESASAMSRAGDAFLRYGYRYDGLWDMTGEHAWCPRNKDRCYWQTSDVFQDLSKSPNVMCNRMLRTILEAGITVWNDPSKIGRI